jgi:hypothetical protein
VDNKLKLTFNEMRGLSYKGETETAVVIYYTGNWLEGLWKPIWGLGQYGKYPGLNANRVSSVTLTYINRPSNKSQIQATDEEEIHAEPHAQETQKD